jgi:CBS domain-containing protein/sporulation protein YlmC with PRC-barrel domain
MLYFAELAGKRVVSADGKTVGRLADLVFLASGQPLVTKLHIQTRGGIITVPMTSVANFNGAIKLANGYETTQPTDNELSLKKHLLDQQIIDLKGNKVVRVNDVAIQEKPYMVIAGVDVGVLGIARWFKLEQLVNKGFALLGRAITSNFLPWDTIQPVELSRGKVVLKQEETKLTHMAPEDLADHLERLSIKNLTKILDILPTEYEAEVIQNLNISRQRALFRLLKPEHAASILSKVDPDEAADILLALPIKRRESISNLITKEAKEPIDYLVSLSRTDIGGLATNEFMWADPEETAYKVKTRIKKTRELDSVNYVYVTNKRKEIVGVFNLYELFVQENDAPVYKFMNPTVVVVYMTTPVEIAIKKMVKYKVTALPLVNDKQNILGIVNLEDLMESVQEQLH